MRRGRPRQYRWQYAGGQFLGSAATLAYSGHLHAICIWGRRRRHLRAALDVFLAAIADARGGLVVIWRWMPMRLAMPLCVRSALPRCVVQSSKLGGRLPGLHQRASQQAPAAGRMVPRAESDGHGQYLQHALDLAFEVHGVQWSLSLVYQVLNYMTCM